MGASSSSSTQQNHEVMEEESIALSTFSLPSLGSAFSTLSSSSSFFPSLERALSLPPPHSLSSPSPQLLPSLLSNLAPSITSLLFPQSQSQSQSQSLTWLDFLKGYNKCCARMQASSSLNLLFKLYSDACTRSGIPCGLEFDPESEKVSGFLTPSDLQMLFLICWLMERSWRVKAGGDEKNKMVVVLPDLTHLVLSALELEGDEEKLVWGGDVLGVDDRRRVSAQKVSLWVVRNVPGIVNCLSQYVQERLKACAASSSGDSILSACGSSSGDVHNSLLLTCGRAWAISLTLRNNLSEELSLVSFPELVSEEFDNILYRSSIHGRGLNRFSSCIEGYHGPLLIIISANSVDASHSDSSDRRWMIGILTDQGFENKETFYGNSGYLYAISPIFRVLSPSGKEKNFIYSHLHPAGRVYQPKPKPVALAFGGTLGNERILIDEDFAKVTLRHHAVDKTYQHGSLIPNQGFLPIEAPIMEVEVWGFGGKAAKKRQDAYKKRETLFSEQRRKVDLKTFGLEDSPEKMMMDMMSDPNKVQREDR